MTMSANQEVEPMPDRDGYMPGVPCWVDTSGPDPQSATAFYGGLFGWDFEDVMPPGSGASYYIGRLRGGDVAAVGSQPEGSSQAPAWNTYIWVQSADEAAAKVLAAGGRVLSEPFEVMEAGRMAACADPEGAEFYLWQARRHRGARIVNEPGSLNFNGLNSRDVQGAKAFYGAVFGWETLEFDGGGQAWRLPGYGDFLELNDPDLRKRVAQLGGPEGFEDVVATLNPVAVDDAHATAHWSVTFAVEDADATAATAAQLGGQVVVAPFDAPWVRMTVLADPQGAMFIASQFVPINRDPGASGNSAMTARAS
jgi:predicted enzyme related to lactoylglutathione lyase